MSAVCSHLTGTVAQQCCFSRSIRTPNALVPSFRPVYSRPGRRGCLQVVAVGWDPEGILAAPKGGHIQRRYIQKQAMENEELKAEMDKARAEARKELEEKRESRVQPTTHAQIVEYLLDTESDEMKFETARVRPLITDEFLSYLSEQIGLQRFGKSPNEERLAELEALKEFLQDAIKALDESTVNAAAPADRLRQLLQAPDKRATLLEMAGNNLIDQPLLDLLQQNIAAAKGAEQSDAAEFMQKVHDAAKRFLITS